jgi:predicted HicB family RNase H-like nuclease
MVSVNIRDFPEELHHRAKIQAAVEKISLKELMIKALSEYLEREQGD